MTDDELDSPHWRLEPAELPSLWALLRRLPGLARPVTATVWSAAPRALLAIVTLQVAAGAATTFRLLSTTRVPVELLAAGPTGDRVTAAVPALLAVAAAYLLRGLLESGVLLAQARAVPAVVREAEERLLAAALAVELAAFEDHRFYDRLHRARDRACSIWNGPPQLSSSWSARGWRWPRPRSG